MNKFYIIVPVVLLGIFGFFYNGFTKEYAIQQAQEEAARVAEEQRVAAEKAEADIRAKEDADRRTAERDAEEARKVAERRAKWEAAGKDIADSTAKFKAETAKLSQEAQDLEIALLEIRKQRETAASEAFDLTKKVEMARIEKRNAELQVQRMTEMVSKRAADSSLTKLPDLTPPAKK